MLISGHSVRKEGSQMDLAHLVKSVAVSILEICSSIRLKRTALIDWTKSMKLMRIRWLAILIKQRLAIGIWVSNLNCFEYAFWQMVVSILCSASRILNWLEKNRQVRWSFMGENKILLESRTIGHCDFLGRKAMTIILKIMKLLLVKHLLNSILTLMLYMRIFLEILIRIKLLNLVLSLRSK